MQNNSKKYNVLHQVRKNESSIYIFEWLQNETQGREEKVTFQRQVIQFFLKNELGINNRVMHHSSGAPFLEKSNYFISISHSENIFALQISSKDEVGIDVQVTKGNIYRGRGYFVNDFEENNFTLNDKELYLIWSAKEAVYKLKKGKISQYREEILVKKIGENEITVCVGAEKITCSYWQSANFIMVFVLSVRDF